MSAGISDDDSPSLQIGYLETEIEDLKQSQAMMKKEVTSLQHTVEYLVKLIEELGRHAPEVLR